MPTHLTLKNAHHYQLPTEFQNDDVRYTEEMASHFILEHSEEGDIIFDPFMGFGTTLLVAEKLGRIGYGVEFDEARWRYCQSIVKAPERAMHGDSTKLGAVELPPIDLSLTSPPYMNRTDKENPFTAYTTDGDGYEQYLADLRNIYNQVNSKLAIDGTAIIEVSNLKNKLGQVTTLAWDIAREVSKVMTFKGEVVITWEGGYNYGYDHSYALIFARG
ncbi:MAG: site-specific DNA-methyltransferase [Candidatus Obscuribacterales bacterium]|nr:site-specific DNA-methyltransferase [Candidatus Obscuribacterales bacterium]